VTYYFYDLETSSASPHTGRIMQFAGQRTDENLEPIGEPDNMLIKLAGDVLPEPDAILVHGITPQRTIEEGLTEVEFIKFFEAQISLSGTVFVGFNNIRFDDEFMRRISYRTFRDPYQWHWKDDRGRWDLLDAIRMMRALRPEGLKWPMLDDKPSVRLGLMAKENGLTHDNAHDAMSDVIALIELAQKFRSAQPKLFEFLVDVRDKKKVAKIAEAGQPFVYTSGRYSGRHEKTTVVHTLFKHPRRDSAVVYDLREDPANWLKKSAEELAKHWQAKYGSELEKLPIKILQYNRCPAVAPYGVLDDASLKRISISPDTIKINQKILSDNPDFTKKVKDALDIVENEQQGRLPLSDAVDDQMYDGFWGDDDQAELSVVSTADPDELSKLVTTVKNKRIREMIPLYKARNFPKHLTETEVVQWEEHRRESFSKGGEKSPINRFYNRMAEIAKTRKLTSDDEYLLTELQLYVESILPTDDTEDQDLSDS